MPLAPWDRRTLLAGAVTLAAVALVLWVALRAATGSERERVVASPPPPAEITPLEPLAVSVDGAGEAVTVVARDRDGQLSQVTVPLPKRRPQARPGLSPMIPP
jgi:hypothetical protein